MLFQNKIQYSYEKFKEFSKKYRDELKYHTDNIKKITDFLKTDNVTLIYGAKSPTINNAVVLRDYILDFIKKYIIFLTLHKVL